MTSISYLLKASFPDCSPSEQQAARFILEHPAEAMRCNVSELAEQAQVSTAAVIRLCKRIHIDGFNTLRLMLAKDVYSPETANEFLPDFNFESDSPMETIASALIQTATNNFNNVGKLLNEKTLFDTVALILNARSIQIGGIGASAVAAMDLYQKLTRLGMFAVFNQETHMQLTAAATLSPKDVFFAFSYSGETNDILLPVQMAKERGVKVIAVTRVGENSLSKLADFVFAIPDTESLSRHGATISRMNQLLIIDILYTALITRAMEQSIENIARTRKAVSASLGRH
ncbi:MurR/RpiR family transcriptional regulator [Treponema sp. OMZ 840]|uniref:MurR/RpiR family transcriptional regulator n=1 Tax=Treponema sp. OMZ 840 TaxID=244313 RepID=UPI003D94A107